MGIEKKVIILLILMILSRALGFFKEVVIAFYFGASEVADMLYISLQIPNIFYSILGGALLTAIVPYFMKIRGNEGAIQGNRFVSVILMGVCIATIIIMAALIPSASYLMDILAPGIQGSNKLLLVSLFKITIISIPLYCLIMVINGVLSSFKKFGNLEIVQIITNFTAVLFVIIYYQKINVYSFPLGVIIGYLIGLIFIIIYSMKFVKYDLRNNPFEKIYWKKFLVILMPIILTLGINQVYMLFEKVIGSFLSYGSIASLNYANKVMQLPSGIFATAISTVYYPELTEKAINKKFPELKNDIYNAIGLITIISLPCAVIFFNYSETVISLLFGYGNFDERSIELTSSALKYYSIGIWFICITTLITKVYYVLDKTKQPLIIMSISIVFSIILSLSLLTVMQHRSIALGFSSIFIINSLILLSYLKKFKVNISFTQLIVNLWPIIIGNLIIYFLSKIITIPIDLNKLELVIKFVFVTFLLMIMYLFILIICRDKITWSILTMLNKKLKVKNYFFKE